jgi:pyrimidine deaminase RibD-like protein
MEPCVKRLSGNKPCVERVIEAKKIKTVIVGVMEPEKFVSGNNARQILEQAGVKYSHVPDLEKEILEVATAGHDEEEEKKD